ncbi:MAG: blaR1 7, partial [Verrucomicrobiales bacterium]|nr:blaR1 7 [Verrucomicrobiales bacterium]
MNPAILLGLSSGSVLVLKWTVLLVLGWSAHWFLCGWHAKWRLILWRSILCFGLLLPTTEVLRIPALQIPISGTVKATESAHPSAYIGSVIPHSIDSTAIESPLKASTNTATPAVTFPFQRTNDAISMRGWIAIIWFAGFTFFGLQLAQIGFRLLKLRRAARLAGKDLHALAQDISANFGRRRPVEIVISKAATSPFVCGLLHPTIILPEVLLQNLSRSQVSALLSHEIAHVHQRDLVWSFGWQWMKAAFWFHPLVWRIPAAHSLACEQEADRIAATQIKDPGLYAQLLAQLALRVISLPPLESRLSLNATSQIAQRLIHLKREHIGTWKWIHSAVALSLAGILLFLAAGWEFSQSSAATNSDPNGITFKEVLLRVEDEFGQPLQGATILPDALRVKGIHSPDAYAWSAGPWGTPEKSTTDADGRAYVKYPVAAFPKEREFTGALVFTVDHPDFCRLRPQDYPVEATAEAIRLTRGILLEVSGFFGNEHIPITDLKLRLSQEEMRRGDWQKTEKGTFVFRRLSSGSHLIQLMGKLPTGDIIYSDCLEFTAQSGKPCSYSLELKPGIRLEGRIDNNVPRPIKNGRALISVRPHQFPAVQIQEDLLPVYAKYGDFEFWKTYRTIAEDGTFTFESIPPGMVDVVVQGDGFISKNGSQPQNRLSGPPQQIVPLEIGVPQTYPLTFPLTAIEVATEPTATIRAGLKTKLGAPIEGALVYV